MTTPPVAPTRITAELRAHNDALAASVARVRESDAKQTTARLECAIARLELKRWRLGGET